MTGRIGCEHQFLQVTTQHLEKELGEVILYAVRICLDCKRLEFSTPTMPYGNVFPNNEGTEDNGDRYYNVIRRLAR